MKDKCNHEDHEQIVKILKQKYAEFTKENIEILADTAAWVANEGENFSQLKMPINEATLIVLLRVERLLMGMFKELKKNPFKEGL